MSKPFDWNDLRFFLAVARSGTISLAGKRTGTDHATVGRRITALEASLGVQLFERNPRGYNLTRHGERMLATATAMEAQAVSLEEDLAGQQGGGLTGTVRISTLEGFGNFFLAARIGSFVRANPRLTVELITIQQIVALSRRQADIAITLETRPMGQFIHERLTDYRLFVYGTQAYLDSHPPIRAVTDLPAHRFAGYIDELIFTRGLDYLAELAPGLRARLQNSSLHAQMEAALSGYGLCVLPAYIATAEPRLTMVLPEQASLTRTYWMVIHADVATTAQVRLAASFLRQEVAAASSLFNGIGTPAGPGPAAI